MAGGEYVAPTPRPTTVPEPEGKATPKLAQPTATAIPTTKEPTETPTQSPTATLEATFTPKPTLGPTPKPTAAATPTPNSEPSVSDADKSIYRDFMWLLMHEQPDRPENELKNEFAKANNMLVDDLDALIRRVQVFVYDSDRDPIDEHEFSSFGELESIVDNFDGVCVLSYVIDSSLTKKMTIEQNFFNVENFIVDGGGDIYKQIQYHAFMITTTGERIKAVTFTVDADLIAAIKSRAILATTMSEYLDDLWVTSQLR